MRFCIQKAPFAGSRRQDLAFAGSCLFHDRNRITSGRHLVRQQRWHGGPWWNTGPGKQRECSSRCSGNNGCLLISPTTLVFTPAKGATLRQRALQRKTVPVSIHAPREGGDTFAWMIAGISFRFNSRPREGGDRSKVGIHQHLLVSIHAPAKGGDDGLGNASTSASCFNSRPREGGDHMARIISQSFPLFQFTAHCPAKGGDMDC